MRRIMQGIAALLATTVASPAFAQGYMRYALFSEPDVRSNASYRTATVYVIDKKENQFWTCSARYNDQDLTANNGSCVKLDATRGPGTWSRIQPQDMSDLDETTTFGCALRSIQEPYDHE